LILHVTLLINFVIYSLLYKCIIALMLAGLLYTVSQALRLPASPGIFINK